MKTLEVFVSAPSDVREGQAVIERVIRSVAAEFDYVVSASYSSRLQRLESDEQAAPARGPSQGIPLRVCFWDHAEAGADERLDEVPNPGQFDLVICLVWSWLGPQLAPKFVAPDGSVPGSATEYEVAWALDQARITPGFPALQVYRNRAVPDVPLEPREAREASFRRWDAVQEFFATWQARGGEAFGQSCRDYRLLEELEALFRTQFRPFLSERANRDATRRHSIPLATSSATLYRGLYPFDQRHATLFHGRTKATREVLGTLRKQAAAGRPFALVLGPNGAGKSSLVRAGVVPMLVRAGVKGNHGPWRRALTRPGAVGTGGNPIEALVAALVDATTTGTDPLQARSPQVLEQITSELRQDPCAFARRIETGLDDVDLDRLDRRLDQQERDFSRAGRREAAELASRPRLSQIGAKAQLVLVVDQFEELFTAGFPIDLQRAYIAGLVALARTQRVFVIATLLNDFYSACQQFPELIEITSPSGRYDLAAPTADELGQIVRWRAEINGLRFERHARTGQGLDDFIVQAALASADELPQLEHLLTRLYERQTERGDDRLLRWSDYAELGGFEGALAQHAESAFAALDAAEQAAADFVLQQIAVPGTGAVVRARTISSRALLSAQTAGDKRPAAVKGFVDRFLKEGFLRTDKDPRGETLVTVSHDVLFRKWTRARLLALAQRPLPAQRQPAPAPENARRPAPAPKAAPPPTQPFVPKADVLPEKPKAKAQPALKRRWPLPWDAVTRKFKRSKPPQSAPSKGGRTARLAAIVVPIVALLAAGGFAIHLRLEKQAQEEARQRRADQAIAAALGSLRNQGSPEASASPGGATMQPETTGAQRTPAAPAGESQPSDSRRVAGMTVPDEAAVGKGTGPSEASPAATSDVTPPAAVPSPPGTPAAVPSPAPAESAGRDARRSGTPAGSVDRSAPLIPELATKKARGSASPKAPDAAPSPSDQGGVAGNASPGETPHPVAKALNSELSYSRVPVPAEGPEKEQQPGSDSSASPDDASKRGRWARRTMPAPNQAWPPPPAVSPAPAPGVPAATPPPDDRSTAAADEASLRALARDYIQSVENNDPSAVDRFFADQVNFYGQGSIGRAQVQDSTQRYREVWPVRKWTPEGKPKIFRPAGSNMYQILQPFRWMVSNGFQSRKGDATLQLLVEKEANGELRIVAVRQLNR